MSASVHFSIKYDGPALATHQMDVRELAPALVALSHLLEEANRAAFPDAPEVRVQVRGSFKGGSFGIDLTAVQNMAQQIVSLLGGPQSTAAANLFSLLAGLGLLGSGSGLIALIQWLRGRRPTLIRDEGDRTIFEVREEEVVERFEAELITGRLYRTRVVRQALAKMMKPLEQEGIDLFACVREGEAPTVVSKEEAGYFARSAGEPDVVSDTLNEAVLLQIESAVFKDGNKWRFSDGASSFHAEVLDPAFLSQIDAGELRFGKGDILVADLRRIQTVTDNGLKQAFLIERVREHRSPLQAALC